VLGLAIRFANPVNRWVFESAESEEETLDEKHYTPKGKKRTKRRHAKFLGSAHRRAAARLEHGFEVRLEDSLTTNPK